MAFGRIWVHGKYSYGTCPWFAYNFGNFQKLPEIEKCQHFFQQLNFDPNRILLFFLPAKAPPSYGGCRSQGQPLQVARIASGSLTQGWFVFVVVSYDLYIVSVLTKNIYPFIKHWKYISLYFLFENICVDTCFLKKHYFSNQKNTNHL